MPEFDSNIANIIALNIKYQLSYNNMSRADLANLLDVSTATIGYWCTGKKIPRMDKVDKMCSIFNVTRSQLLLNDSRSTSISSPAPSLPPDQASILAKYGKLNTAGKEKLQERADELIVMGYTEEEEIKKKEEA